MSGRNPPGQRWPARWQDSAIRRGRTGIRRRRRSRIDSAERSQRFERKLLYRLTLRQSRMRPTCPIHAVPEGSLAKARGRPSSTHRTRPTSWADRLGPSQAFLPNEPNDSHGTSFPIGTYIKPRATPSTASVALRNGHSEGAWTSHEFQAREDEVEGKGRLDRPRQFCRTNPTILMEAHSQLELISNRELLHRRVPWLSETVARRPGKQVDRRKRGEACRGCGRRECAAERTHSLSCNTYYNNDLRRTRTRSRSGTSEVGRCHGRGAGGCGHGVARRSCAAAATTPTPRDTGRCFGLRINDSSGGRTLTSDRGGASASSGPHSVRWSSPPGSRTPSVSAARRGP
jgi:hypothetical protein